MQSVSQVIYLAGGLNRTLPQQANADDVWSLLKRQFPELANGTYAVSNGVMTVELRTGSKAVR